MLQILILQTMKMQELQIRFIKIASFVALYMYTKLWNW